MFLLILRCPQEPAAVSVSLHSTMFLLIHDCLRENSLNIVALHSTMFLLIRIKKQMKSQVLHFTFHDVSINTGGRTWKAGFDSNFTFHDVSINTKSNSEINYLSFSLHSTMFLLIPDRTHSL